MTDKKPTTKRTEPKKFSQKENNAGKVSFTAGNSSSTNDDSLGNAGDISSQLSHMLSAKKQHEDILRKSVKPVTIRSDIKGKYEKNKIVFSAKTYHQGYDGVEEKGYRRLSDDELREISQVDPYISAIISTRCSQGSVVARASESKFDKGTRILDMNPLSLEDFDSEDIFKKEQERREKHSKVILDWVWNCGTRDKDIINEVFSDPRSDKTFKQCTLADFLNGQMRNLLTFGRMATQIFRNEEGLPVMFRPIPIETIQPLVDKEDTYIGVGADTFDQSREDVRDYNSLPEENRPYAYVQRVDGRNVNFFTEDEIRIDYFQKQALFDLRGYPLAPIEMALFMVFIHQNTLNYMRNQFIKGLGTKGVLTLESTDVAAELSNEDLEVLRREFHNFLSRTDNSSVTPVISGPVKVNWLPLSATPRDMEFLQIEEHVIRALCASFQTSPQEMGYGHLSINGQGAMTSGNKQEEIVRGEERGLRMLLDIIYDCVNEIFYENFEEGRDNFRITYTGVGEDTRDAVVQRHNQELNTTATLGSLWADSEKNEPIPMGANVPLSPLFHSSVVRYMKYGEFMEKFMGVKGAADKPEYDFIIDPSLNQAYSERIAMTPMMMREQGEVQIKTQEGQLESMEAQTQAMEAQMQMPQPGMEGQDPSQEGPPPEEPQGDPGEEQPEQAQKSLHDEYHSRETLKKSMSYYFSEWIKTHSDDDDQ